MINHNFKVSIAIITYNSSSFIKESIDSALSQDYPNLEIIISDDASTDGTQKILESYAKQYPEIIKVILLKTNVGAVENWFKCTQACQGKYIAGLAGDDEFLPGKISKQVAIMEENTDIAICYSDASVFDVENNREIYRLSMKSPTLSGGVDTALSDAIYYSPTIMFRKELLPKVNTFGNIRHAADLAFFKEVMINSAPNGQIYYLPEALYLYKKHNSSITSGKFGHYLEHIKSIKILQKKHPRYAKALGPSIYDFCSVALFKTLAEFNIKNTMYFLTEGFKASNGNPFRFFRSVFWAIKFYIVKAKLRLISHLKS